MTRRALTLIEILAATVLLALLAAVCVPMLRHLTALAEHKASPSDVDLAALSALADLVIRDPASFGLPSWQAWSDRVIPWPNEWRDSFALPPETTPVNVRIVRTSDPEINRVWLLFTCNELVVARCRFVSEGREEPESP